MGRVTHVAASALILAVMALPAAAADTASAGSPAPGGQGGSYTFDQYRDYQVQSLERRQAAVARRLQLPSLSAEQRARAEEQKARLDWQASMPGGERDRRLHERFNQIDANHDGVIDDMERTAWSEKQR